LDVTTNFSFLRGASHADELVYRAAELGYRAVAVTDINTLAGVVRAHEAAKRAGIRLVVGARLAMADSGVDAVVWCADRSGYAALCRTLTRGKRRAEKGTCDLRMTDVLGLGGEKGVWIGLGGEAEGCLGDFRDAFGGRLSLLSRADYGYDDGARLRGIADVSRRFGVPMLACNHVHYHDPSRRVLQDVLTCIREKCTIRDAGYRLFPSAERYLKAPERMHRLFRDYPRSLARAVEVSEACVFSLGELKYEYPDEISPAGVGRTEYLRRLTEEGALERYPGPGGVPGRVRGLIEHELELVQRLGIEAYFLTVYDIVKFARSRGILCQGRGSAANSAVCYCIGITSVDPARIDLLFERFVSAARDEPPDIDVDFEHERREEVIQYVYGKYGRERCAMTAEVHTYRGRSAVRDVGKALGLGLDAVDRLAKRLDGWNGGVLSEAQIREAGFDPADATIASLLSLTRELLGFPRHLSQHVGGLVVTRSPLEEMVPIENAAMADRTVIEWDKDDIDAMGMLKVDCLALGMLTAIRRGLGFVNAGTEAPRHGGGPPQGTKGEEGDGCDTPQELLGHHCMAAGQAVGQARLHRNKQNAAGGNVWPHLTDAKGVGVDSIEHCVGLRASGLAGLPEVSPDRPRIAGGTVDTVRDCFGVGVVAGGHCDHKVDAGSGARASGLDPEFGEEADSVAAAPSVPCGGPPPPCLGASVPFPPSPLELHTIPPEDPAVYDMICRADTVGVFQIESRAQMSMLPRLRPRCFYDLVIEVAIVRPGPIQGKMVHPYLRRRSGEEAVTYPSPELEAVLGRTLGVPLFQEQAMKVAMVAAGFSADEADRLRRSMAAWRYNGAIEKFRPRIVEGMLANGYTLQYAEQTFEQIRGFGEYGFPESHAASFALLVYASCWLKRYHPAAFCAALLNSQPMGFYAPAQLVRDAREHGVEVRPVDVNRSEWESTLEAESDKVTERQIDKVKNANAVAGVYVSSHSVFLSLCHSVTVSPPPPPPAPPSTWGLHGPAVRLGFDRVRGMGREFGEALVAERRARGAFVSVEELHRRTNLPRHVMAMLAEADAFSSLAVGRRAAAWEALAAHPLTAMDRDRAVGMRDGEDGQGLLFLPEMPLGHEVMLDYATTGLSLKSHPVSLVRDELAGEGVLAARVAVARRNGSRVKVAGLVLTRQRPGTASGLVFITLEDETGVVNLIVRPPIWEKYRTAARHAGLLMAHGTVETHSNVTHVLVSKLEDRTSLLSGYRLTSRDFH